MNSRMMVLVKMILTGLYVMGLAGLLSLLGMTIGNAALLSAFIFIVLGISKLHGGGIPGPMMGRNVSQGTLDSADLRSAMNVEAEVAHEEQGLKKLKGRSIDKELWVELLIRRESMEILIPAFLVGLAAFYPYLQYFL